MRLINADTLEFCGIGVFDYDGEPMMRMEDVRESINNAPTIDAVPVVRCRECEYRKKLQYDGKYHCCNEDAGMAAGVVLNDNDFCSYGKPKEGVD